MEAILQQALAEAKAVRGRAYAPYSEFRVGAAVKARDDKRIYSGCNIENASYGATVCAERVALWSMLAARGAEGVKLELVLVVTEADPPGSPCGECLQVLAEFADPDTVVALATPDGVQQVLPFSDFLPRPFDPTSL